MLVNNIKYFVLLFFFFISIHFYSQNVLNKVNYEASCDNEDFENATVGVVTTTNGVTGWITKQFLYNSLVCNYSALSSTILTESNPDVNYIEVYNAPNGIIDPNIGTTFTVFSVFGGTLANSGSSQDPLIPQMFGNKFIRINKDSTLNRNHTIEKTFLVTNTNCLFRFAYLPVVKPKPSNCCEQAGVYINFFNASANNTLLTCPSYSITGPSPGCINQSITAPGLSVCPNNSQAYYHNWKIVAVDLSAYIGSNIKFKIGGLDCNTGCDYFGYTYLDAQCGPMEIKINGIPYPAITNTINYNLCLNSIAAIEAPANFISYNWVGPASFTSTQSIVNVSTPGVYTLTIGNSGGCSPTIKYINIVSVPNPTVVAVGNPSLICAGNTASIIASGALTYSLNGVGSNSVIAVTPTVSTTYTVSGMDANSCLSSSTVAVNVVSCVGLKNYETDSQNIYIYPNPSSGNFKLKVSNALTNGKIEILNLIGQKVFSEDISSSVKEFEIKNFGKGVYIYNYTINGKSVELGKIIIQ